jgi:hypothetical protein
MLDIIGLILLIVSFTSIGICIGYLWFAPHPDPEPCPQCGAVTEDEFSMTAVRRCTECDWSMNLTPNE